MMHNKNNKGNSRLQNSGMLIREQLKEIVGSQETGLCFSTDQCQIAIQDLYEICEVKAALLVQAVACEVTSELLRLNGRIYQVILLPKLASHFRRQIPNLTELESQWVVDSWAMALSVIPLNIDNGGA